jgi:hypothetical protein
MIQSRRKSTSPPQQQQQQQRAPFVKRTIPTPLTPQELPAKYKSAERK